MFLFFPCAAHRHRTRLLCRAGRGRVVIANHMAGDAPFPATLRQYPRRVGISLRHFLAIQGLVPNGRIVAVSQGHVWTQEADGGLAPCSMASLNGRSFHHRAHKFHNLCASLEPDAERILPICVVVVISCQDGSVKVFPALLPVVNDRPNCRLILGSSRLDRCSLLRCRCSGLRGREPVTAASNPDPKTVKMNFMAVEYSTQLAGNHLCLWNTNS